MSSHFEGNLPIVVEVDLSPLYVIIVKVTVYLIKNPNTDLCSSYIYIYIYFRWQYSPQRSVFQK